MFDKLVRGLKKDNNLNQLKRELTPEEQKERQEKVKRVSEEINQILKENNCAIIPITEIAGSRVNSFIQIVSK